MMSVICFGYFTSTGLIYHHWLVLDLVSDMLHTSTSFLLDALNKDVTEIQQTAMRQIQTNKNQQNCVYDQHRVQISNETTVELC